MTLWGERVELDDETESDHFENIQSTNWQTLRFKPPPPNSLHGALMPEHTTYFTRVSGIAAHLRSPC